MGYLLTLISGAIFAVGLGISGMTNANKVIGFLDIGGAWDPSLAFVMVGAIGIHAALYPVITKRATPLFATLFHLPTQTVINKRLVIGASLFGAGWGLGGYCPGPALVSLLSWGVEAVTFCGAMLLGMVIYSWLIPQPAPPATTKVSE